MEKESKTITIQFTDDETDIFHYKVCEWKGHKVLVGWHDGEEDNACDITDLSDLRLYQFEKLYMQLAIHGHLLDLELTVHKQTPVFSDNDWRIAKAIGKMEKE